MSSNALTDYHLTTFEGLYLFILILFQNNICFKMFLSIFLVTLPMIILNLWWNCLTYEMWNITHHSYSGITLFHFINITPARHQPNEWTSWLRSEVKCWDSKEQWQQTISRGNFYCVLVFPMRTERLSLNLHAYTGSFSKITALIWECIPDIFMVAAGKRLLGAQPCLLWIIWAILWQQYVYFEDITLAEVPDNGSATVVSVNSESSGAVLAVSIPTTDSPQVIPPRNVKGEADSQK